MSDVLEDRLREIFEIKEVKSTSRAGISVILIETQDWVDNSSNEELFSEIRDAIGAASSSFPEGAMAPVLMKSGEPPHSLYYCHCALPILTPHLSP